MLSSFSRDNFIFRRQLELLYFFVIVFIILLRLYVIFDKLIFHHWIYGVRVGFLVRGWIVYLDMLGIMPLLLNFSLLFVIFFAIVLVLHIFCSVLTGGWCCYWPWSSLWEVLVSPLSSPFWPAFPVMPQLSPSGYADRIPVVPSDRPNWRWFPRNLQVYWFHFELVSFVFSFILIISCFLVFSSNLIFFV